jgi:hypothetical protein
MVFSFYGWHLHPVETRGLSLLSRRPLVHYLSSFDASMKLLFYSFTSAGPRIVFWKRSSMPVSHKKLQVYSLRMTKRESSHPQVLQVMHAHPGLRK